MTLSNDLKGWGEVMLFPSLITVELKLLYLAISKAPLCFSVSERTQ